MSVARVCSSSRGRLTTGISSVAHIPLHSAHSCRHQGPVSWYPKGRFGHLLSSAASSVSQHVPSPHEIGESWQSLSKPHNRRPQSKTRTGRCRRPRTPGRSGGHGRLKSWWLFCAPARRRGPGRPGKAVWAEPRWRGWGTRRGGGP